MIARVLPVPAPASTHTGPVSCSATARWSASRAARRASASGGAEVLITVDSRSSRRHCRRGCAQGPPALRAGLCTGLPAACRARHAPQRTPRRGPLCAPRNTAPPAVVRAERPRRGQGSRQIHKPCVRRTPVSSTTAPVPGNVVMYSTTWCGYCRRLKAQLRSADIPFTEVNIEEVPEAAAFVEQANGGDQTVPTLLFPDGSSATNPSLAQVQERLAG